MDNIKWEEVKENFEIQMTAKLNELPGHREVPENLLDLRSIISHEIPETSPADLFDKLIKILLRGKPVDVNEIKKVYLYPELERERLILTENTAEFERIKKLVAKWIEKNLSEQLLQTEWKEHKTWLPRRYAIYKDSNLPFQEIATDTLARYYLINSYIKIQQR